VSDTGKGIPASDVERIFEPFYQGANQEVDESSGSGLGLSICRQLIRLHGGRMWVESELCVGTAFYFDLPVTSLHRYIAGPASNLLEEWIWHEPAYHTERTLSASMMSRPRVLVYDTTGSFLAQLAHFSDEIEFVAVESEDDVASELDGCPAHAVVANLEERSVSWPVIDAIKRQAPNVPVICCSVAAPSDRAKEAGALGRIMKPVELAGLEKAMEWVGRPVERVMVIDDDPDVLKLLTRMLKACVESPEIVTAQGGLEGLQLLHNQPVDLVLLDIMMPDINGWEVLARIRQDSILNPVPVVFLSAQDPEDQGGESDFFATLFEGTVPINKLLQCGLGVSRCLLASDLAHDQAPV
jgi:CheY-like chemotaxis protein